MFNEAISKAGGGAEVKLNKLKSDWVGYVILSLVAGFYIGAAMYVACVAAAHEIDNPDKIVMGLVFSIGLMFVVFAGAELYTGNVLTMALGVLSGRVKIGGALAVAAVSLAGNVIGGALTALLIVGSGLVSRGGNIASYILRAAEMKMTLPPGELFIRAMLCNVFVTLALWLCWRVQTEGVKVVAILISVFAFVASGYEHCIANAFLLPAAMLVKTAANAGITVSGYFYNLALSILGNLAGGLLVGVVYFRASGKAKE